VSHGPVGSPGVPTSFLANGWGTFAKGTWVVITAANRRPHTDPLSRTRRLKPGRPAADKQ